jgi:hypothetical protein
VLKEPRDRVNKLEDKYQRAIFLGFSSINSAWLFGIWSQHKNINNEDGLKFRVIESRNAKFTTIKVIKLEHLKSKQNIGLRALNSRNRYDGAQVTALCTFEKGTDSTTPPDVLGKAHFYSPLEGRVDRSTKTVLNPTLTSGLIGAQPNPDEPRRSKRYTIDNTSENKVYSDRKR